MKINKTIRKIFLVMLWLIIGSGITVLLVAANRKDKGQVCRGLLVSIKGAGEELYIDKEDIISFFKKENKGAVVDKSLKGINLAFLERKLEKNSWIRDAELYFDNSNVLHVIINERKPIARVFTKNGNSFYIDSSGMRMNLLADETIRVPVITNFTPAKKLNASDSALLFQVKTLTQYISNNEFWNAQVGQIDIVDDRYFEIIPTIGNHVIRLGEATNLESKFNRLLVFYQQVLSKAGFDKYKILDAQFDEQIVATQKGTVSKVDSLQLQKNIKALLEQSQMQAEENLPMDITPAKKDSIKIFSTSPTPKPTVSQAPNPIRTTKKFDPKKVIKKEPKALMKKVN